LTPAAQQPNDNDKSVLCDNLVDLLFSSRAGTAAGNLGHLLLMICEALLPSIAAAQNQPLFRSRRRLPAPEHL
jgi:hypothetical protein